MSKTANMLSFCGYGLHARWVSDRDTKIAPAKAKQGLVVVDYQPYEKQRGSVLHTMYLNRSEPLIRTYVAGPHVVEQPLCLPLLFDRHCAAL